MPSQRLTPHQLAAVAFMFCYFGRNWRKRLRQPLGRYGWYPFGEPAYSGMIRVARRLLWQGRLEVGRRALMDQVYRYPGPPTLRWGENKDWARRARAYCERAGSVKGSVAGQI